MARFHTTNRRTARRTWCTSLVVVVSLLSPAVFAAGRTDSSDDLEPQTAATERSEYLQNGDFSTGFGPWWSTASVRTDASDGELVITITAAGANPWDAIVGQSAVTVLEGANYTLSFRARADTETSMQVVLQQDGGAYTPYLSIPPVALTTGWQTYTYEFTSPAADPGATFQFHIGGQGEHTIVIDDVSLDGPTAVAAAEEPVTAVKVNHLGYLPGAVKHAVVTVQDGRTAPLRWRLYDSDGTRVAAGRTTNHGADVASAQWVHHIDFSAVTAQGTGYVIEVAGQQSYRFDILPDLYATMANDALHFFYHQRSGIAIRERYVPNAIYARPAGHVDVAPNQGDAAVRCFDGVDTEGTQFQGCDYTLDLTGGWYDAGDHGKYVVNGGISVWTLLNHYERTLHISGAAGSVFADGTVNIPEQDNGVPDILDEARWQIAFMLAMQVPAGGVVEGRAMGGMVHHKMADVNWTALPTLPHLDPQPRVVYPPSTAATLNMAAVAAQCARLYDRYAPDFARDCLAAAELAWQAALANPAEYAANNFTGSGPYDDTDVSDEFYWAAAELYITTGGQQYLDFMRASEHYLTVSGSAGEGGGTASMFWGEVAALGNISLLTVPAALAAEDRAQLSSSLVAVADGYLDIVAAEGYRLPLAVDDEGRYPWGSNSSILNNQIVLGVAYDLTADRRYLDGIAEGMDYLLGRNPLTRSYISGYGENAAQNMHHRFWANQKDPTLPNPPAGVVSGGPNSSIQDPVAQVRLVGCAPQHCYLDDIDSWSTNELTINWNAPLVWVSSLLHEASRRGVLE